MQSCIKIWDLESKSIVDELRCVRGLAHTGLAHTCCCYCGWLCLSIENITTKSNTASAGPTSRRCPRRPRCVRGPPHTLPAAAVVVGHASALNSTTSSNTASAGAILHLGRLVCGRRHAVHRLHRRPGERPCDPAAVDGTPGVALLHVHVQARLEQSTIELNRSACRSASGASAARSRCQDLRGWEAKHGESCLAALGWRSSGGVRRLFSRTRCCLYFSCSAHLL